VLQRLHHPVRESKSIFSKEVFMYGERASRPGTHCFPAGILLSLLFWLPAASRGDCVPGWETYPDFQTNTAYAVEEYQQTIYRGGWQSNFLWTGSRWEVFGGGISGDPSGVWVDAFLITAPQVPGEDSLLVVAGHFPLAGGVPVNSIATWDGEQFAGLGGGVIGSVEALIHYKGDLIACGLFDFAGGVPARNIARWDGSAWHPLGNGLYDLVPNGTTDEGTNMVVWRGDLYVAGDFTHAGESEVSYLARWDGTDWSPVGGGVSLAGGSPTGTRDVEVYNDELYVVGCFDYAGPVAATNIARWDGEEWHAVGSGSDPYNEHFGLRQAALSLCSYKGLLYAGADFSDAVGPEAAALAVWDGASWQPVDGGIQGELLLFGPVVIDLETVGSRETASLLIGGDFDEADGEPTDRVARYTYCEEAGVLPLREVAARSFRLDVAPNPTARFSTCTIDLERTARVKAALYDGAGRKVESLLCRPLAAGRHQFRVDLGASEKMGGGIYFVRVEASGEAATRTILRLP
jgi:hypothetical protein